MFTKQERKKKPHTHSKFTTYPNLIGLRKEAGMLLVHPSLSLMLSRCVTIYCYITNIPQFSALKQQLVLPE